jgi:hypothetical protein
MLSCHRSVTGYILAFAREELTAGDPVSHDGRHQDNEIIATPYNGKYLGISEQNVVNIDLTKYFGGIDVQVGGRIHVITAGIIRLSVVPYAEIGGYIRPSKRYKWKATSKRKKKSIGQILSVDNQFMEIKLL